MHPKTIFLQVFDYIEALDYFVLNKAFAEAATALGLNEWHQAVWIGRYFLLDNDCGEHWFDNRDERKSIERAAAKLGCTADYLMVTEPTRFKNNADGPCHTDEERKQFWHDVLFNLKLSLQTLFNEAIKFIGERSPLDAPEGDEIHHSPASLAEVKMALIKKHSPSVS